MRALSRQRRDARPAEDISILREPGLGAYRFSIAWSRIVPDASGAIDRAGLDHHERMVDELLANGIEPFPTLFHWDLPQWIQDAGGWSDRSVIRRIVKDSGPRLRDLVAGGRLDYDDALA